VGIAALGAIAVVAVAVGLASISSAARAPPPPMEDHHGHAVPTTNETRLYNRPILVAGELHDHENHFGSQRRLGATNQVSGEILVNKQDPAQSRLGQIRGPEHASGR